MCLCFVLFVWQNNFAAFAPTLRMFRSLIPTFWSLSLAAKLREACFDPGNVMNGTRIGTDYKLGSMVTFNCEAGYLLQGYSSLTCVMGSSKRPEWDRAKPSCQGERRRLCVRRVAWKSRLHSSSVAQYILSWVKNERVCVHERESLCMRERASEQAKQALQCVDNRGENCVRWTFTKNTKSFHHCKAIQQYFYNDFSKCICSL